MKSQNFCSHRVCPGGIRRAGRVSGEFSAGELNDRRTDAVKAAFKSIAAAAAHPELRSISPQAKAP